MKKEIKNAFKNVCFVLLGVLVLAVLGYFIATAVWLKK